MRHFIFGFAVMALAGCSTLDHQPTLQQFRQAQTREYVGVSPEQIFEAASEIFRLADGISIGDGLGFRLAQQGSTLRASRTALEGIFFRTDEHWSITASQGHDQTTVVIFVERVWSDGPTRFPRSTGEYGLFYARLDYLLGLSSDWMTCEDYETFAQKVSAWENEGYLCSFADDTIPNGPLVATKEG